MLLGLELFEVLSGKSRLNRDLMRGNAPVKPSASASMLAVAEKLSQERLWEAVTFSWPQWLIFLLAMTGLGWWLVRARARLREDDGHAGARDELLRQIDELHAQGVVTDDEYRLINRESLRPGSGASSSEGS